MARTNQLSLFKDPRKETKLWWIVKRKVYGGSLNYRKVARPFDSKKLTHSVFKAQIGKALWFTRFERPVREAIAETARRYGINIRDVAVNRNHIHILFYTKSKEAQTRFLRLLSADLGRMYKKLRKKLKLSPLKLWESRPFTRLVSWGKKSLAIVHRYIRRNRLETLGFIEYRPRIHALGKFLTAWSGQAGLSSA